LTFDLGEQRAATYASTTVARPLRGDIPNGLYHVTCRGLERRAIVRDDRDRSRKHIYEETRDGSAPGCVGFGTLFAPQTIARREGKECLGWLPIPTRRSEAPQADRLPSS